MTEPVEQQPTDDRGQRDPRRRPADRPVVDPAEFVPVVGGEPLPYEPSGGEPASESR